ncbi:unnamed protein product [Peronospora belbahrii]|nr:unnamed protein product [Peronospora belbahrii]
MKPYNDTDANDLILRANAAPNYTGGFNEIMQQMKAKTYYTQQFQRIQQQTNMSRLLSFSNVTPTFYESTYLAVSQDSSVFRVRACFFIGFVGLTTLYMNEWQSDKWSKSDITGRSKEDEMAIIVMTFGIMLPSFVLGFLATFTSIGRKYLENITATVFVIVAAMMIAKKPVEKVKGPVIPLLILLIPIFGITRMRYVTSCCIGWGLFFSYLIVMMSVRNTLPIPSTFDSYTDISYQAINYGITTIGGMVSQYRQELLRRRNFCLQLPFSGAMDADAVAEIKTDKFSKKALMHNWSLKFRHPDVEECFYRYWYLIDPFPYENPNSGSLHQGVFRTIRFAVLTLLLNQLVLLLQDVKFLKVKRDNLVDDSDLTYALVLRFGVTVPLYFSAALFMYFLGKAFYARWVKEAEDAKNAALTRDSTLSVGVKHLGGDFETKSDILVEADRSTQDTARMKHVVETAYMKHTTKERIYDVLINKGGYVRSTQIFSSVVIACHVCCMGILLLAVSTGPNVDAYVKTQKSFPGQPKPVYYMGFLNAVLFAHRSGFRVRFIYATYTTFVVALGIIIAASSLAPAHYQQYAGYVSVILLMGMMISYEEESLRRTFFVLKSIRTLEFEEWFSVVLRIQGWVRERFRKKLHDVRSKGSKDMDSMQKIESAVPLTINTSAQMAYASKLGMYTQIFNIIIAVADVITSSL